jgi:hypothetical protein
VNTTTAILPIRSKKVIVIKQIKWNHSMSQSAPIPAYVKDIAAAFMAHEALMKPSDYLQRGRLLASIDTDELKGVIAFRAWARDPEAPQDHRERCDIEAERPRHAVNAAPLGSSLRE